MNVSREEKVPFAAGTKDQAGMSVACEEEHIVSGTKYQSKT
jgi:hypothetical protein